jgi:uncharacterized membrane protein YhaH (DUF805 family)
MDAQFIAIIQTLVAEQGREALLDAARCKAFLADYTRGEYKKESRLLLQAVETDIPKAITETDDIASCKTQVVQKLQDEYFLAGNIASDVVDMLVSVLIDEKRRKEITKIFCRQCGKELQEEWKACPYCLTEVADPAPDVAELAPASAPVQMQPLIGQKKNMWHHFVSALKKYVVFKGRAQRAEFWTVFIVISITSELIVPIFLFILPCISAGVRRMHDCNKSGWFILVPIYSIILAFKPGTVGPNRFGPDPRQQ